MSEAAVTGFRELALASLVFSKSPAQTERRNSYDKAALKELAENIRSKGVIQPIVVRPNGSPGTFEVVAGERRATAARAAGLETIPAIVRELTDEQALDINLIENLQRQALHELVECEGYEELKNKHGLKVEQIAAKVGKTVSYVYKRLELSACGPEIRKAFFDGKIDVSKALFLSRLKGNDLQKKALKDVLQYDDEMPYREFVEFIRRQYMRRLDQASFDTEDPKLLPGVGPCSACPMNTAAAQQTALFGNVSKEDASCSDGTCFGRKTAAAAQAAAAQAKAAGRTVLEGKAAARALQNTDRKYSRPTYNVPGDSQYRSFEKVLGKYLAEVTTVAIDPESGAKVDLVDVEAAKKLIKEKGIKLSAPRSSPSAPKETEKQKADRERYEAEVKLLAAVLKAIHEKPPKPFTDDELAVIAEGIIERSYRGAQFLDPIFGEDKDPDLLKLNGAGLQRVIRTYILAQHAEEGDKKLIFETAKRHGVDVKKVEVSLAPKPGAAYFDKPTKKAKAAKKK